MLDKNTLPGVDQLVTIAGSSPDRAQSAMILLHGRGASAQDILLSVPTSGHPNFTYLAPQAPDNAWYPNPFSAPLQDNEPHLSSSLECVSNLLTYLSHSGIPPEHTILLGFSQGACLAMEYAARNARRYGGVAGLSGGLIGPDDLQRDDRGSLEGTPIFLGCSDVDPYISKYRVQHAADALRALGGSVTIRFYTNMGHTINEDELDQVRKLMDSIHLGPSG